jgi:hypothetical protein
LSRREALNKEQVWAEEGQFFSGYGGKHPGGNSGPSNSIGEGGSRGRIHDGVSICERAMHNGRLDFAYDMVVAGNVVGGERGMLASS